MEPRLDGYQVVGLVGEGGMAEVWLAEHPSHGTCALKVLRTANPRLASRLRREGAVQQAVDHPHIVRVLGVDTDPRGVPVLRMDYVKGPTLEAVLMARHRLSIEEVDVLARGLLRGVCAAHAHGWVHRDLKPANVLLAMQDGALVPKVTDFGLAKDLDDDHTGSLTQHGAGTRRYMSIEQLSGAEPDQRMDVFSLGAVLWEMIEGQPAFERLELWRTTVDTGEAPPLTREVPERMRVAVARALAQFEERPADAQGLLSLWESGSPVPEGAIRTDTLNVARELTPRPRRPVSTVTEVAAPPPARGGWGRYVPLVLGLVALLVGIGLAQTAWQEPDVAASAPLAFEDPVHQRRFALAWEQFADARLDESERTLISLAHSAPPTPDLFVLLALNRVARQRYQTALDALAEAKEHADPKDDRTLRMIAALEQSMFRVVDGDPWPQLATDYPDDLVIQAVGCSQLGLRPEADLPCDRARAIDELPVMSWVRGQWALWEDDHAAARGAIDDFLARSPQHPLGYIQEGWWQAAFSNWGAVEEAAQQALAIDPGLAEARLLLAHVAAHQGDLAGRDAQMELALSETTSLPDRLQLALWEVQAMVGLGQVAAGQARLAEAQQMARDGEAWFWIAQAALEHLHLGWLLQDPEELGRAVTALEEAGASPDMAAPIRRRVEAARIYAAGLQAAVAEEALALDVVRGQLRGLDHDAVGVVHRDTALALLDAYAADLRGDAAPRLALARTSPGCEATVRGGVFLLERGMLEQGVARLQEALTDLCPQVGYSRYLRVVARKTLADQARMLGDDRAVARHEAAVALLWPPSR